MTSQPPLCNISRTTKKGRGALTSCVLIDLEAPLLLFVLNIQIFSGDETKAERLPSDSLPQQAERQQAVADTKPLHRPSHQSLPAGQDQSQPLMGSASTGNLAKAAEQVEPLTLQMWIKQTQSSQHINRTKFGFTSKNVEFVRGLKSQDPYRLPWCCLHAAVPC